MNRKYSIIIVTWNACDLLRTFLPSVMGTDYESFEVIIADNASTDETAEWVNENYPQCNVITFSENHGYCGGNNRAASHASGDILLFLNNDVQTEPNWLTELDKQFETPEVAAVQPKIRSYIQKDKFEYAGAAGGFLDSMGYPFCRGRIFQTTETDTGQYDDNTDIFWASGAAMAIRKDIFMDCGGFDESFRFHMEEIDLCWRLLNEGYKIAYSHSSVVYHLGGGSLPTDSPEKIFYNFRNSLQMLWKNATGGWLGRRFFLRLCLDGAAGIRLLLAGKFKHCFAILMAHFDFYKRWRVVHLQRQTLLKRRTVSGEPDEILPVNVIWEYFFRKKRTFSDIVGKKSG